MVLSTFALGLLQEWLDESEDGQKLAAESFREFARKAGLMHMYNKQLEHLLVYAWDRCVRSPGLEHGTEPLPRF
eukprot:SAG22_NODE_889_length_6648_cov_6.695984_7_plen_74_part_00